MQKTNLIEKKIQTVERKNFQSTKYSDCKNHFIKTSFFFFCNYLTWKQILQGLILQQNRNNGFWIPKFNIKCKKYNSLRRIFCWGSSAPPVMTHCGRDEAACDSTYGETTKTHLQTSTTGHRLHPPPQCLQEEKEKSIPQIKSLLLLYSYKCLKI